MPTSLPLFADRFLRRRRRHSFSTRLDNKKKRVRRVRCEIEMSLARRFLARLVAFFGGGRRSAHTTHPSASSFFRGEFSWRFKRERVDEVVVVVVVVYD